jgi:hypothetical protein
MQAVLRANPKLCYLSAGPAHCYFNSQTVTALHWTVVPCPSCTLASSQTTTLAHLGSPLMYSLYDSMLPSLGK